MSVRYLNPETLSVPSGYTHVVEVRGGRTVYISGQVPFDKAGNVVGAGDFAAQTTQVFENLKLALASVGATFDNVVKNNTVLNNCGHGIVAFNTADNNTIESNTVRFNATSLTLLILLALGTFVAGVHAAVWRISAVGVFLALSVPAVAWVQESAMLLLVGTLLLILVGAAFWWMWRRESRL